MKHNKRHNVAIIFECFSSFYSDCVVNNKQKTIAKLNLIFERYFKNTELTREYQLYEQVKTGYFDDTSSAKEFISLVIESHKKLNQTKLSSLKEKMLNEISQLVSLKQFFNYKINDYKVYASFNQILRENANGVNSKNYVDVNNYKKVLVENLLIDKTIVAVINENAETPTVEVEQIDSFDIAVILEKYNEKYQIYLNEDQQRIIHGYFKRFNDQQLNLFLDLEKLKFIESCDSVKNQDPVVLKELKESLKELNGKWNDIDPDIKTLKLLEGYGILQQLK